MITVFTPTYNRAYLLPQLFDSLQRQTRKDFEWVVVDDGSTDNTQQLFENWMESKTGFPIYYYYKENGGKHTAHNVGVTHARGDLFLICDSDDYLVDNAIEIVQKAWDSVRQNKEIGGIIAYRGEDCQNTLRNKHFTDGIDDAKLYDLFLSTGIFDTVQIYRTEIMRDMLFPEYKNELFFPENYCWTRIDLAGFKVHVLRKVVEIAKYREDGLTVDHNNITGVKRNIRAFRDYSYVMFEIEQRKLQKLKWAAKYNALSKIIGKFQNSVGLLYKLAAFPLECYFYKQYK